MFYQGTAKLDKRTKNLVTRLNSNDIAIIDHKDIDRVSAEGLIDSGIEVVINTNQSISGRYPNIGPLLIASAGIHLIDSADSEIFNKISEGEQITIQNDKIISKNKIISQGKVMTVMDIQKIMEDAEMKIGLELEKFAQNTLQYMQEERSFLLDGTRIPDIKTKIKDRHVLVVTRGYEYKEDLQALRSYIREFKPLFIGVDGGADAILNEGYRPDIIIGDMDSVSDNALMSNAELVVHAYVDGRAPGKERLDQLNLDSMIFQSPGTSEDLALLLAYEKGAELIVAVGTHANLVEFLDKGRAGMASTFLIRLKVGSRLVDAKGVNKLYRAKIKISHLILLIAAAILTLTIIILSSPSIQQLIRLVIMSIRSKLRI